MNIVKQVTAPPNSGWASPMEKGQVLRLTAMTIIDFVAFNDFQLACRAKEFFTGNNAFGFQACVNGYPVAIDGYNGTLDNGATGNVQVL